MSAVALRVLSDVLDERRRQIDRFGWTEEHDDEHEGGELALAAAAYAMISTDQFAGIPDFWPWDKEFFKPASAKRDLIRAAALLLAELERVYRFEELEQ